MDTAFEKFRRLTADTQRAQKDLVAPARAAAALLRDLGHPSSAVAIEAVLFRIDAAEEEGINLVKNLGPADLIDIMKSFKPRD